MASPAINAHQLGFAKFADLDPLNQQHLKNMFSRLSRRRTNTAQQNNNNNTSQKPPSSSSEKLIHKNSLPTLLGSIGLILPQQEEAPIQQPQQQLQSYVFGSEESSNNDNLQQSDHLNFEQVVSKYDDAINYCGVAMSECMEFFAVLDDDGDGVIDVGVLREALCGEKNSSKNNDKNTNGMMFISEAEFYFALDAAKLLTGPDVAVSTFDEVTGSRLDKIKVDDELNEDQGDEENFVPPTTSVDAHLTGTIVPGGLTVYQFLNVILKFAL